MISHRHRCIFVEIPKTGSTSVRAVIGKSAEPHLDICELRREMTRRLRHTETGGRLINAAYGLTPEAWRRRRAERAFHDYFKFAFVRNPWDRVVSLYHRQEGERVRDEMSFDDFARTIRYSSATSPQGSPHVNQLDYLVDPSGHRLVDFVGRFERLDEDWATVAERLGLPPALPHKRKTDRDKPYTDYYTDETRAIIAERFAVDVEAFGYRFGG
mgnify:CR=1 FL=1